MTKTAITPTRSYQTLLTAVRQEILRGQEAVRHQQAATYWNIGKLISTHLLQNKDRAGYGDRLFDRLAENLPIHQRVLHQTVQFYRAYPKIVNPGSQFKWSHYRQLMKVKDPVQRNLLARTVRQKKLNKRQLENLIKKGRNRPSAKMADSPARKLTPLKGELYTYKIAAAEDGAALIDCGFEVTRRVAVPDEIKLTAGLIIQSAFKDGTFVMTPLTITARALYTYKAEVKKVIDGDTLAVNIDLGFDTFARQKLRLRGIDTPEAGDSQGKKAKTFVQNALKGLEHILIRTSTSDKYDRYLADVFYGKEETFRAILR